MGFPLASRRTGLPSSDWTATSEIARAARVIMPASPILGVDSIPRPRMNEERSEVAKGTALCPACGGRLVPILYGLPSPEGFDAAERGEVALGGCTVTGNNPQLRCASCGGAYWISGNARSRSSSE